MSRFIFDENGEQMIINNLENYLTVQLYEDIEKTLQVNLYWNYMNILLDELVNDNKLERVGKPYNQDDIELTIDEIKRFMTENLNYDSITLTKIDNNVKKLLPKK